LPQLLLQAFARGGVDSLLHVYRTTRARYYGSAAYDFGEVALSNVAEALVGQQRLPDAVRVQLLNLEMYPSSSFAHWMAAQTQLAAGDSAGAVATLRKAVALNPNNQGPRELLSRLGQTP
jgi:tetratricopeptide (TPR) repeat protein